jgi:hypothetical protein
MRAACLNYEEKMRVRCHSDSALDCIGAVLTAEIGSAQDVQFAGGSADVLRLRGLDYRPEHQAGTPGQNSALGRPQGERPTWHSRTSSNLILRMSQSEHDVTDADLVRFLDAQSGFYDQVTEELTEGRKRTHWMWFIFPQLAGLGHSPMAQRYAIRDLDQAARYLAHPLLGSRLRLMCG